MRLHSLALILCVALLAACGSEPSVPCFEQVAQAPVGEFARFQLVPGGGARIHYEDGTSSRIPARIRRVVTAVPGITEAWVWLDGADRLAAVSPHCDHPKEVLAEVERVTVLPLDTERLLALEPDLVIVDRTLFRSELAELGRLLPGLLALETSRSLPHLEHSFEILARVVGSRDARARVTRWRRRLATLLEGTRAAGAPGVLAVGQWQPLYAIGNGGLFGDLLRACGARNLACDLRHASGPFEEELLIARGPDWIVSTAGPLPPELAERWRALPAVAAGRVASARANDLVRGGPRLLHGLERLSALLQGRLPAAALADEGRRVDAAAGSAPR